MNEPRSAFALPLAASAVAFSILACATKSSPPAGASSPAAGAATGAQASASAQPGPSGAAAHAGTTGGNPETSAGTAQAGSSASNGATSVSAKPGASGSSSTSSTTSSTSGSSTPTGGSTSSAPASGSAFPAQEGWVVETPTSGMRKAQFRLPHAEKDADDASLVVYYFGTQAGTLQANIDRWCGQFEQPDGKKSSDVLKSSTRTVNGISVHEIDLSGTYVAETAPGSGERVHKDGWRMLAAVFEAKDGPYYAKLVGPSGTIGKWEASFRKFVEAARPGGGG